MDDYISRQAAIDALKEEEYPCESDYDEGYMAALDKAVWIMEKWMPSAQPEIIRCKDCKHKNVYRFPPKYDERDYCEKQGKVVDVADFCSWAERREE